MAVKGLTPAHCGGALGTGFQSGNTWVSARGDAGMELPLEAVSHPLRTALRGKGRYLGSLLVPDRRPACPKAIEAVWGQQLPAPSSMKGKYWEAKAPGLQPAMPAAHTAVSPSTIKSLFYCNRATSALPPRSLHPFFLSIFLSDSAKQCLHS